MRDLGASEEEVLTELRKQRQERLKAPEESLERVHRIQTHGPQAETCGKNNGNAGWFSGIARRGDPYSLS